MHRINQISVLLQLLSQKHANPFVLSLDITSTSLHSASENLRSSTTSGLGGFVEFRKGNGTRALVGSGTILVAVIAVDLVED